MGSDDANGPSIGLTDFLFEGTNYVWKMVRTKCLQMNQVQEMVSDSSDYLKRNEKKHGNK